MPWTFNRHHGILLQTLAGKARTLLLGAALALASILPAQQMIWTDTFNGGVVTGTFSIGDHTSGIGVIWMELPEDATVRKAILYVTSVGGADDATLDFQLGSIPISLGPATAGPVFNTLYGTNILHTVDLTGQLDPTVPYHLIDLTAEPSTTFKEYMLIVEYELPGMGPITLDIIHLGEDSALEEHYTLTASHPISTDEAVAFATMAGYCRDWITDYETVTVNGTVLGNLYGADYNSTAGNQYGACATFHYASGIFEGIGDDDPDMAISGADALSELSTLIAHGDQSFQVSYAHTPTLHPGQQRDNIVNLALLAYAAAPCDNATAVLGPDTLLCPGETLLLDATRDGATYLWQDGSTAPTFEVNGPGTYYVEWGHPDCTWEPDTIVVGYVDLPEPALGPDRELCEGAALELGGTPSDGVAYEWADGHVGVPRSVEEPGLYVLTVSRDGCSVTDSVRITAKDCRYGVELPNVFTPNGDGSNQVFAPILMEGVSDLSFTIYNRWGQEVYQTSQPALGWDGRNPTGEPVPAGTYFWVLRHTPVHAPETVVVTHGTLTLLR